MTKEDIKEMKKLSPEARINKLKKLQEENKEEIAEAQKIISESEEEIATEEKLRDIPIPQLKAVSIDALFSPEEKELFRAKRFAEEKPAMHEETKKRGGARALEEVAEWAPRLAEEERQAQVQYQIRAEQEARKPARDLYNEMRNIYQEVRETGEITPEQMERVHIIRYADIEKVEKMRKGDLRYAASEAQAVARELVASQRMGDWINRFYRGAA